MWQILEDAGIDPALLRRFYLLLFVAVATREVRFGGITTDPTAAEQSKPPATSCSSTATGWPNAKALVRERGSQFTRGFDEVFGTEVPRS